MGVVVKGIRSRWVAEWAFDWSRTWHAIKRGTNILRLTGGARRRECLTNSRVLLLYLTNREHTEWLYGWGQVVLCGDLISFIGVFCFIATRLFGFCLHPQFHCVINFIPIYVLCLGFICRRSGTGRRCRLNDPHRPRLEGHWFIILVVSLFSSAVNL